jgi:TPP-dependent indolepyruvate ferredoxin oxidoreductase alpha subunit
MQCAGKKICRTVPGQILRHDSHLNIPRKAMCRYERRFLRIKKLSLLLYHAQCAANRVQRERARSDAESFKLAFEA